MIDYPCSVWCHWYQGDDQHDKTKVVAVIETAFATHGANGYEVLQQTIISRVKTSTPRGRGKTK